MLDFLRAAKRTLYGIISTEVFGFQIDTGLHLVVGFVMMLLLHRFFSLKKSLYISFGLIVLKELVDKFAKSLQRMVPLALLGGFYFGGGVSS